MKYTHDFLKEAIEISQKYLTEGKEGFKQFSIDIEDFAKVPPYEICKCMDSGLPFDAQERLTRFCILGKPVKIYLDDELIETIILNKLDDRWEIFRVFDDYPLALQTLIDICVAHITKKFVSPSKNILQAKAATGELKE